MEPTQAPTPSQPTTNPPGGGSWAWDGIANQWVSASVPTQPATISEVQE